MTTIKLEPTRVVYDDTNPLFRLLIKDNLQVKLESSALSKEFVCRSRSMIAPCDCIEYGWHTEVSDSMYHSFPNHLIDIQRFFEELHCPFQQE